MQTCASVKSLYKSMDCCDAGGEPAPPSPPPAPPPGYLTFPPEFVSKDGLLEIDLDFDVLPYESEQVKFVGRGYNGVRSGPLWRVKAGDKITVHLHNKLTADDNMKENLFNDYHKPNTTNLHTHGLHVSSKDPGDNVLVEIPPGESRTYVYELEDAHMAGNHWYHAHFHGSTTIQVSGGAAGMIIVDDAPGEVPDFVREMKEVPILLNPIPASQVKWIGMQSRHNTAIMEFEYPPEDLPAYFLNATETNRPFIFTKAPPGRNRGCQMTGYDAFPTSGFPPGSAGRGNGYIPPDDKAIAPGKGLAPLAAGWAPSIESCILLVNGQELPRFKMNTGEWYRMRLTQASALNFVYAYIDGVIEHDGTPVGACEMALLGKDGVYLPVSGRTITRLAMPAGGRSDFAFRCSKPGMYKLIGMDPNFEIATDHMPKAAWLKYVREGGLAAAAPWEFGYPGYDANGTALPYAGPLPTGFEGEIMHFEVVGEPMSGLAPFPMFKAQRPCYLADLTEVPIDPDTDVVDLDFADNPLGIASPPYPGKWESDPTKNTSKTYYNTWGLLGPETYTINSQAWDGGKTTLGDLEVGKVYEAHLYGVSEHPAHIHVNSFQLMDTPPGEYGGYMMKGDWHDTAQTMLSPWMVQADPLMGARAFASVPCVHPPWTRPPDWDSSVCYTNPYVTGIGPPLKVRFQTDKFAGESIVHCHILLHEDLGMMGMFHISGEEGTVWPDARKYEPTCSKGTERSYTMV